MIRFFDVYIHEFSLFGGKMNITLEVNYKKIALNTYVKKVFVQVIIALVKTLKGVDKKINVVKIEINNK